ncbi:hypothetical protein Tco_0626118 [Tanacetum coccineum]|uniref:Uncharacterized protein n=1 Tax=Tanacetum coccineum TaxID=301880 RepID=A0ABQ4WJH0_9ASTR
MAYFVTIPTPDSAWSCVMQCTLPTKGMRSIISMVSISLEGFLPSILLLVMIIIAVVIVAVILVVVVVAIVGVVIVVMIIGDKSSSSGFLLIATGIPSGPVFLLGLSAFAMAAACASRAAAIPSLVLDSRKLQTGGFFLVVFDSVLRTCFLEFLSRDSLVSVVDQTSDEDPTDEDGDIDDGKTAGKAIITWGGGITSYACMFFIYRSSCKGEKTSNVPKRSLEIIKQKIQEKRFAGEALGIFLEVREEKVFSYQYWMSKGEYMTGQLLWKTVWKTVLSWRTVECKFNGKITVVILVWDRCPREKDLFTIFALTRKQLIVHDMEIMALEAT